MPRARRGHPTAARGRARSAGKRDETLRFLLGMPGRARATGGLLLMRPRRLERVESSLIIFFSRNEQGSIELVEMSLKFFACAVVCNKSKAVSPDHLHLILICSSNVAYWLWFFEQQSWRGKFSDICDEIQIGVVPFLYYSDNNKQLC